MTTATGHHLSTSRDDVGWWARRYRTMMGGCSLAGTTGSVAVLTRPRLGTVAEALGLTCGLGGYDRVGLGLRDRALGDE